MNGAGRTALGLLRTAAVGMLLGASPSWAAVPAGYAGTPHGGTPRTIPGRINLVDYDDGGKGVGFNTVHAGDVGCAGYDYRSDRPTATLCKTSTQENDHWSAGPLMGMPYPSATTADYYVGAIRPGDWVNVTVDVKTAGTYRLSTDWASAGGQIDIKLSFNGVLKNELKRAGTGDYHNWIPAPDYATVQLEAGVQVMQYLSVVEHVNLDYIQLSLVSGDGGVDPGTGGGGGAGQGGATADAGTGGAAGATGTAGAAGAAGATGTAGAAGTAGDTGTSGGAGAGGAPGMTGGAGAGGGTGAAGAGARVDHGSAGGCACQVGADTPNGAALGVVAVALALWRRRRVLVKSAPPTDERRS